MRYDGVARPVLLGLLALAGCRQSTQPPVSVGVSPGVTSTGSSSTSSAGPSSPAASTGASPSRSAPSGAPEAPLKGPDHSPGLQGTVSAGPACPVERVDSPCPPRPLSAEVDARDASGRVAATTRSGGDGRYRLALPPGTYTLTVASTGVFPRCPTPTATVAAGRVATVDISCDTGIR